MIEKAKKALTTADNLTDLVNQMISETSNLDLQRILKQVDADLMDIKHKLSTAATFAEKGV
ncbi:MAG: hypothetical protein V3W18_10485 [candidate division Zixibacteria bacterium]